MLCRWKPRRYLINALELGVVQRLGSQRPVEVDARIIASTSANMETLIAQGASVPICTIA